MLSADLKEAVHVITEILDEVHITQFVQHQVSGVLGEGHLGSNCTLNLYHLVLLSYSVWGQIKTL